eukprot:894726-Karenia_brevis.AAC.1
MASQDGKMMMNAWLTRGYTSMERLANARGWTVPQLQEIMKGKVEFKDLDLLENVAKLDTFYLDHIKIPKIGHTLQRRNPLTGEKAHNDGADDDDGGEADDD